MSLKGFVLVAILFLLFLSPCGLVFVDSVEAGESSVVSAESEARLAIGAAEERIVACYRAVADANEAGANTTVLIAVLNEAGKLLSRAKLAYEMKNFDSAQYIALSSEKELNGVFEEADVLRGTAIQQCYLDFMINVAGSIVGAVAVVCGSFVVWLVLKRRYAKT